MQYKPYMATLHPSTIKDIKSKSKKLKLRATELVRIIIERGLQQRVDELAGELMKAKAEAEIKAAQAAFEKAKKRLEEVQNKVAEVVDGE